jgi:cellulose synthase/poly-beta-1,6-N-acetylglucosamine synthase-like glycosyltransferase
MKITVLVPTYRRTSDLARCLDALARQRRAPDEVLVVCRGADEETQAWLAIEKSRARLPLVKVEVIQGGQVAALNAGLDALTGDIVAITDDDAAPRPTWLDRIERHFASSPDVGGVGGRDWVHEHGATLDAAEPDVGRWQFPGRAIGNHHLGVGAARDVDFLKGANMSYRVSAIRGHAIRFDTRLRGTGAQVNNDMAFASAVRRAGWRLVYDPAVEVDHYPAQRFDEDARTVRGSRSWVAIENESYNLHLIVRDEYRGARRRLALMWLTAVGQGACLGLLNLARARFIYGEKTARQRWRAARSGATLARRDYVQRRLDSVEGELAG